MDIDSADRIGSQLNENEFRVSDVPPGSVLRVGKVAVFNVARRFCATHSYVHIGAGN
jgi:hypothetical protein